MFPGHCRGILDDQPTNMRPQPNPDHAPDDLSIPSRPLKRRAQHRQLVGTTDLHRINLIRVIMHRKAQYRGWNTGWEKW